MNGSNLEEFYRYVPEDVELMADFFLVFSRLEYAIKRAGLLRPHPTSGLPEVAWSRFARRLEASYSFEKTEKLEAAAAYLLANPPKQQRFERGRIVWDEVEVRPTDTEVWRLLGYVRLVRNNLFHGGKYEGRPVSDPSRDEELIRSCLLVIDAVLDLDAAVREYFLEPLG